MPIELPRPDHFYSRMRYGPHRFADPALDGAKLAHQGFGAPSVLAGKAARTYQFTINDRAWAVRCYLNPPPDLRERYEAIARFIARSRCDCLVDVEYQERGIEVDGAWHPIVKRPWLPSLPSLQDWLFGHNATAAKVLRLRDAIAVMARDLQERGAAHGNLHADNIFVTPGGQPILVDYDDFFAPGMEHLPAFGRGHPNYQHPRRDRQFGAALDRFSLLVLYVGLTAMNARRWAALWKSETVLFRGVDLRRPESSALFAELRADPATRVLAERLADVAAGSFAAVPTLDEFLSGEFARSAPAPELPAPPPLTLRDFVDPQNGAALAYRVGQETLMVGRVQEVIDNVRTADGEPFVVMYLGQRLMDAAAVIVRGEALEHALKKFRSLRAFDGRWVLATGVLEKDHGLGPAPYLLRVDSSSNVQFLYDARQLDEIFDPPPRPRG